MLTFRKYGVYVEISITKVTSLYQLANPITITTTTTTKDSYRLLVASPPMPRLPLLSLHLLLKIYQHPHTTPGTVLLLPSLLTPTKCSHYLTGTIAEVQMLDCCFALYLLSCLELQTGIEWFSSSPKPGLIEKLYTHSNICLLCVLKQIRVVLYIPFQQCNIRHMHACWYLGPSC